MPTFAIERWDPVVPPGKTEPQPMIYIKPDKDFAKYAEENDYTVAITITDTGLKYDSQSFVGIIDTSGVFPNDRPNFFDATGFYVITIFSRWLGYPPNNGSVLVQGKSGPDPVELAPPQPYRPPEAIEMYDKTEPGKTCNGFSDRQITMMALLLLTIFGVLFAISFRKKDV